MEAFKNCKQLKKISIPPTVTKIGDRAFWECNQVEEVELCEGLQEIGEYAFYCCKPLYHIAIPSTVVQIHGGAFCHTPLLNLNLPDGIQSIGHSAFCHNQFTNFRVPPLISTIPDSQFCYCDNVFSVELPESIVSISGEMAFHDCYSLRNIAIPMGADVIQSESRHSMGKTFGECVYPGRTDLNQVLGPDDGPIINALKHRFENLPIHKIIYYQSYNVSADQLISVLDDSGKEQDCLGMTPLHILACSTVQNFKLYQVLVTNYPESLITEDKWGAIPLLYAIWGNAPDEIVKFLAESYQSMHPKYQLNWPKIVETLGLGDRHCKAGNFHNKKNIQNLIVLQKESFPDQSIDWAATLEAICSTPGYGRTSDDTFRFIIQCSILSRVNSIGIRQFRTAIMNGAVLTTRVRCRRSFLAEVELELARYETEYARLKDATTILELALWKKLMSDEDEEGRKRKHSESQIDLRHQCRISCGADIVIDHVLPYLVANPKKTFKLQSTSERAAIALANGRPEDVIMKRNYWAEFASYRVK